MKILDEVNVLEVEVGETVLVRDPATGEMIEFVVEALHHHAFAEMKIYLTSADSRVYEYNENGSSGKHYGDYIRHVRIDHTAAFLRQEWVDAIKYSKYTIDPAPTKGA